MLVECVPHVMHLLRNIAEHNAAVEASQDVGRVMIQTRRTRIVDTAVSCRQQLAARSQSRWSYICTRSSVFFFFTHLDFVVYFVLQFFRIRAKRL